MPFSALSRLVHRLFWAPTTRPIIRSAFKPTLEALDQRTMPALFTWTDATGDNQFSDPYNWADTAGVLSIPGPGDDVLITNFAGGSGGPSTGGGTGAGGPSGGSADCYGMQSDPGGPFNSITITAGYTGTVTVTGPVQTDALYLNNGTIDQPAGSGSDITVLGGATLNDNTWWLNPGWDGGSDFYWTGGTLDSTNSGATLHISGAGTTGVINPVNAGAISTGDTLSIENGASATFQPGTLTFTGGTGLVVNANCLATIEATGPDVTFSSGTAGVNAPPKNWIQAGGKNIVNGAGTWDGANLPLENDGGTFRVRGGATASFTGVVGPAGQTGSYRQTGATGLTLIENGSTIQVASGMYLAAGKLATFATTETEYRQPTATLVGNLTDTGADIVISDDDYNAAGVQGHQYGTFKVTGNVVWSGGVYRPFLGAVVMGDTVHGIADFWKINGTLTVTGGPNGAMLGPIVDDPAVTSGAKFSILNAVGGTFITAGSALPSFQLAVFTLMVDQTNGTWILSVN
jgi:hypothetical protein